MESGDGVVGKDVVQEMASAHLSLLLLENTEENVVAISQASGKSKGPVTTGSVSRINQT